MYKLIQSVNNGTIHKRKYYSGGDGDIRPLNTIVGQNDVYKLMDKLVAAEKMDAYLQLLLKKRTDMNIAPELWG